VNDPKQIAQPNSETAEKLPWVDPELALAPISDCTAGGRGAAIGIENATYRNS